MRQNASTTLPRGRNEPQLYRFQPTLYGKEVCSLFTLVEGVKYETRHQIMTNFYWKNSTKGKPPNVPHLCPIENYWATLKRAVYAGGYQAKSLEALKRRNRAKIREIDQQVIVNLFRSIKANLIKTAKGPYAIFK